MPKQKKHDHQRHKDRDRPARHRKALLVGVSLPSQPGYEVEEHLDELADLANSTGVQVVGRAVQHRKKVVAATFIGKGKAEEIATGAKHLGADLLIFDDDLSASQVKNLEEIVDLQVMDRSALILELFDLRAKTREARTQVELARLNYLLPRLTRRWTHLSRQVGGIGVRGGEGETQLEADRRILRGRIKQLKRDLKKIEKTRSVQRGGRSKNRVVALAGYTNAGKSTLFNRLTQAGTYAEDKLFATLDSKLRRGAIGPRQVVVFADTVGFIRKLPHHLVASFKSTLEEIAEADLVLHVIDRSNPRWEDQKEIAEQVLADLGIETDRILTVYNKIDMLDDPVFHEDRSGTVGAAARNVLARNGALAVSAASGAGLDELKDELCQRLYPDYALPPVDAGDYRVPTDPDPPAGDDPEPTPDSVDDPAPTR